MISDTKDKFITPLTTAGLEKARLVVGTQEEAISAAGYRHLVGDLRWEHVGSGSYRRALRRRCRGSVVYKVTQRPDDQHYQLMQQREVALFKGLADYPWVLPATLWQVGVTESGMPNYVVAMPYVERRDVFGLMGDDRDFNEIDKYFTDTGRDNVAITDGGRVIVLDGGNTVARYEKVTSWTEERGIH